MLKDEIEWFDAHQPQLEAQYGNRVVVVHGRRVVSDHADLRAAHRSAVEAGLRDFLIRFADNHDAVNVTIVNVAAAPRRSGE
jgi:hypothetical protein